MDFGKGVCSRMGACVKDNAYSIVNDDFYYFDIWRVYLYLCYVLSMWVKWEYIAAQNLKYICENWEVI